MSALDIKIDRELLNELEILVGEERRTVAEVVRYLAEVDKRGIYRDEGYPSLFAYCTEGLGYSEGGAGRRTRAARCLQKAPEVYEQLVSGKVTLCSLQEIAPLVTVENRELMLGAIEGASKREAQKIAVSFGAPVKAKRSTIRARKILVTPPVELGSTAEPVVEERCSFSFEVTKEIKELYDQAKAIMGHVKPEELFERLLRDFVEKKTRTPKVVKTRSIVKVPDAEKKESKPVSRAVPAAVRREVFKRDKCQCTFVSQSGKRCSEKLSLEIDHIKPFAQGGDHSISNLRLLCRAHNQLHAEKCFGREFMRNSTGGVRNVAVKII